MPFPTLTTAGVWPQPVVLVALQVAVFTTATRLPLLPNATYMVCVAVLMTGVFGNRPMVDCRRVISAAGGVGGVAGGGVDHRDGTGERVSGVQRVGGVIDRPDVGLRVCHRDLRDRGAAGQVPGDGRWRRS